MASKFNNFQTNQKDSRNRLLSIDYDLDSELYDSSVIDDISVTMTKYGSIDKKFYRQPTGSSSLNNSEHYIDFKFLIN